MLATPSICLLGASTTRPHANWRGAPPAAPAASHTAKHAQPIPKIT
jgi:hypothetical protein